MKFQAYVDAFNSVEVVLWIGLAIIVLVRNRQRSTWTTYAWSVALLLFGVSDMIELQTGAFWRPWWLLLWKGACIACFVWLAIFRWKAKAPVLLLGKTKDDGNS